MSWIPAAVSVAVVRGAPVLRSCVLLAALAVAGCGPVGLPSPTAIGAPATSPAASAAPGVGTSAPTLGPGPAEQPTQEPTEQPGPPIASLVVAGGPPARGDLGSYVWDGAGSDSPWLVPPEAAGVRARGPYAVTVVPPLVIERWEAAWARVGSNGAGDPEGAVTGDGAPVAVPGPAAAGTWSLMVDIRFAGGNHAAWYWRVEVMP